MLAVSWLCGYITEHVLPKHRIVYDIFHLFACIAMQEVLFMMIILTADRLVCIINPLLYKLRVTETRLKKLICVSWTLSLVFSLLFIFKQVVVPVVIFILFGSIYILLVIATYSIGIVKIRQARVQLRNNVPHSRFRKEFLVPGLIISTYILLYFVPLLTEWLFNGGEVVFKEVLRLLVKSGLGGDPMIYVFLTKRYRDIIINDVFCGCCRRV